MTTDLTDSTLIFSLKGSSTSRTDASTESRRARRASLRSDGGMFRMNSFRKATNVMIARCKTAAGWVACSNCCRRTWRWARIREVLVLVSIGTNLCTAASNDSNSAHRTSPPPSTTNCHNERSFGSFGTSASQVSRGMPPERAENYSKKKKS